MKKESIFAAMLIVVVLCCGAPPVVSAAKVSSSNALDYSFMWWAHGFRGEKILNIQTDSYGLSIDTAKVAVTHLGKIAKPLPYEAAVAQDNDVVFKLPKASLELKIKAAGKTYTCTGATKAPRETTSTRMIDSGRFAQRADILNLVFVDAKGTKLAANARLEIVAWPDRLNFILEIVPQKNLRNVSFKLAINGESSQKSESGRANRKAGSAYSHSVAWVPGGGKISGRPKIKILVTDKKRTVIPAIYDEARSLFHIKLPHEQWNVSKDPDHLQRVALKLQNTTGKTKVCRLLFASKSGIGITGMCPMLRDSSGNPTGIPVQISKNWHGKPDPADPYRGAWFHGFTMLRLPPHSSWKGEFDITYARWGGVPAASHAQLCLIGWGTNQMWQEAAIGAWGESICYDPDVCLKRSMIDDIRPLMVWGMAKAPKAKVKWNWTNNVGGGDFLVYYDAKNKKQYLTRMRTAFTQYGPNLTEAIFAGVSADGNIAARISVSTPRCDDINRSYHHVRYDVLKPTTFKRLAFYQLGADKYNDSFFDLMARGSADKGLIKEWVPKSCDRKYSERFVACEGRMPWFSLHKTRNGGKGGAWPNRGLIVRSWKARLGGKDCPTPCASFYSTGRSRNVELSPPQGLSELKPGDFVEFDVELVVIPKSAADYYGPNENLRADLAKNGDTWKPVHRQAQGNDLKINVSRGRLLRAYPPMIEANSAGMAEFEITGGVGYVPVTITGLKSNSGSTLMRKIGKKRLPLKQSVHGNDYWQTDYDNAAKLWRITYNVSLDDAKNDTKGKAQFVFGKAGKR